MSLQIALQQIQLPSFFGITTASHSSCQLNRSRTQNNDARRAEIVKILRAHGKPMDYATLGELTGWTLFSLRNLLNTLVKDGQVMRSMSSKSNGGRALVEWVK